MGAWLHSRTAIAADIDFAMLLDGLATDVDDAVLTFLRHHHAEPIAAEAARDAAPQLRFAVPPDLAGGFRLEEVYAFPLGREKGIAARYRRERLPLVVFFHRPATRDHLGVHSETPCYVEGRRGESVEVGPWRLVHFTDPTTCHCVLSTLDLKSELPKVMAAIAPDFAQQKDVRH
jgi:hypothetical protein